MYPPFRSVVVPSGVPTIQVQLNSAFENSCCCCTYEHLGELMVLYLLLAA